MKLVLVWLFFALQPVIWTIIYIHFRWADKYVMFDLVCAFSAVIFMFFTAVMIAYLTDKK